MTLITFTDKPLTTTVASSPVPIPVTELAPIPANVPFVKPIPVFPSNVKPSVPIPTEAPIETIRPVFVDCFNSCPLTNIGVVAPLIEILCVLEYAITGFFFLILPKSNLLL